MRAKADAGKFVGIELARGVAALLVVLYHVGRHLERDTGWSRAADLLRFTHAGVDLFFVISGFIIFFIHAEDVGRPEALGRFALRRFIRIYPTYWVLLGLTVATEIVGHGASLSPGAIAIDVFLLPSWDDPIAGIAWTLRYEMVFYAVFASLIVSRRLGLTVLFGWLALLAVSRLTGLSWIPPDLYAAYNLEFPMGMVVAWLVRRTPGLWPGASLCVGVLGFAASAVAEEMGLVDGDSGWACLAYGSASALVLLGAVRIERRGGFAVPGNLLALGKSSYSIYLFHLTGMGIAYKLLKRLDWTAPPEAWAIVALLSVAGIAVGMLASRLVEFPLMNAVARVCRAVGRRVAGQALPSAIPEGKHETGSGRLPIGLSGTLMNSFRSRLVIPEALTSAERQLWDAWCVATPGLDNPFLSYPYATAVARLFPDTRICVIEEAGEPVAFFPFHRGVGVRRWLGAGRRLAGELSDYFGIVARPGTSISPETLLRLTGLKSLLFTHLDESQAAFGLFGEKPEPGLRVTMPNGGAAFWSDLRASDKRFVSDTERRLRKLVEAHGPLRLTFHNADPAALAFLVDRKRDQYRRTGAGDVFDEPGAEALLRGLLAETHPLCTGVLTTLKAGDVWVASHFGLRCRDTLHFWFPVYNPDLHSFSPGRLLVTAIIQQADEVGLRRLDRGAGDSAAKRDFANEEHLFRRGLWQRPGPSALLARAGLAAAWRLRRICVTRQGKVT